MGDSTANCCDLKRYSLSENRLNKLKATGPPPPPANEVDADAAGMRRLVKYFQLLYL